MDDEAAEANRGAGIFANRSCQTLTSQTAREFDVEVWGQACRVAVFQKSESVWVAVGDYKGKRIEVKDRSQAMALAHWRNTAQDRGT